MNNDGFLDIFGVGNVYDAEIETIKNDASKSFILLSNSVREFQSTTDKSFYKKKVKAVKKIIIDGILHFIIPNKNKELTILKANNAKI